MGKGDERSRKGKIYRGSYGNSRSHSEPKPTVKDAGKGKK